MDELTHERNLYKKQLEWLTTAVEELLPYLSYRDLELPDGEDYEVYSGLEEAAISARKLLNNEPTGGS